MRRGHNSGVCGDGCILCTAICHVAYVICKFQVTYDSVLARTANYRFFN